MMVTESTLCAVVPGLTIRNVQLETGGINVLVELTMIALAEIVIVVNGRFETKQQCGFPHIA